MTKLYDEDRDAFELDKAGGYYTRHVVAMTKEGLHSKSDIAAELAYRDMVIDELKAQVEQLREEKVQAGRDGFIAGIRRCDNFIGPDYAWVVTDADADEYANQLRQQAKGMSDEY